MLAPMGSVPVIQMESRPQRELIGLAVEAPFAELATEVPAAWRRLAETSVPAETVWSELSIDLGNGRYREVLGLLDPAPELVIDAEWERVPVPAGDWLVAEHSGAETAIAETFGLLLEHAAARGLEPTGVKLDVGYRVDGAPARHELCVAVRT
jgi:predicted transcriptional regulator YdeE